jgi:transposase InsO family protein
VLRIENGGELCRKEFEQFCKQCGIAHQNTTPYNPQQNGVVERMNITLMDKERSMLSGARLTQEFWAKVVETAKYLLNRSPSLVLFDSKKIGESWTRRQSSVFSLDTRME